MTDHLADDGYLAAGYEYIVIDDCWLAMTRDPITNRLQPDPKRFPSGIRALADYVHSRGLKFGIYEDYGTLTCGGFPGSIDHLELDAQTFADWTVNTSNIEVKLLLFIYFLYLKVDYLKLDGCYADIKQMDTGYPLMGKYLNATNRPIVYSCSWPAYQVFGNIDPNYARIAQYCNLWRNYDDIDDSFDSVHTITEWYAKNQDTLSKFHGPGHWNDPDMLIIGNYGLSYDQAKGQMALWSILSAPLLISTDLRVIPSWFKSILQNKNLIAINQDKLGIMGKRFTTVNSVECWSKKVTGNRQVFVFFYPLPYGTPARVDIKLSDLNLVDFKQYDFYESFSGELIGHFGANDTFKTSVDPSGSVVAFWAEPSNGKQLLLKQFEKF
jgi:hypothetical protein